MKVGAKVISICSLNDDEIGEICIPGDRGEVVDEGEDWPLVRFERTGRASIVDPDTEIVQTRHAAFASA
jgi:hypothetical protein